MQLLEGGVAAQTRQCLENMKHILAAGGSDLSRVVKTTVLLHEIAVKDPFLNTNKMNGTHFCFCQL